MIFITVCVVMLWKCNTDDYECVISYDERERESERERQSYPTERKILCSSNHTASGLEVVIHPKSSGF